MTVPLFLCFLLFPTILTWLPFWLAFRKHFGPHFGWILLQNPSQNRYKKIIPFRIRFFSIFVRFSLFLGAVGGAREGPANQLLEVPMRRFPITSQSETFFLFFQFFPSKKTEQKRNIVFYWPVRGKRRIGAAPGGAQEGPANLLLEVLSPLGAQTASGASRNGLGVRFSPIRARF